MQMTQPAPQKVAIFLPSLGGGGAERAMLLFAQGACGCGHPVDVVCMDAKGPLRDLVPPQAQLFDLKAPRMLRCLLPLWRYIRAERPDLLYSTIVHANLAAVIAGKILSRTGGKVILRESNSPVSEEKFSRSRALADRLMPILYPLADGVIAVSEGVKQELLQRAPRLASRIQVLPTPVVDDALLTQAAAPVTEPWLCEKQLPVILAVGRLHRQKNFALLLHAFQQVRASRPCRLIILGEGKLREELETLATALGISDAVKFPGFAANPFAYMSKADVFALSSDYEGMPNVLIQALSLGAPVVATDCPSGPRECLENGKYGMLVPTGDVSAFSAALEETLKKNSASSSRIETARVFREIYSVEEAARRYLAMGTGLSRQ